MKVYINTENLKECSLFVIIILVVLFNKYKYGTLLLQVLFVLLPLILLMVSKKKVIKRALPFLMYAIVWCVSFLLSTILYCDSSYVDGFQIIYIWLLILFTALFMGTRFETKQIKFLFWVYINCNVLVSFNILYNYFIGYYYMDQRASFYISGTYLDPNYVSSLIVPALYLAVIFFKQTIKYLHKIYYLFITILMMTAILITGSRAALVGILCAIGLFILLQLLDYRTKFIYKVGISVLVIIAFVVVGNTLLNTTNRFTDISAYLNDIRIVIWGDGIKFWMKSPIIGNGINSTSNYTLTCWYNRAVHNCFIDLLGDSGIIGILCLLGIIKRIVCMSGNKKDELVFATICMIPQAFINGFYGFNFWFLICMLKLYSDYDKLAKCKEVK